MLCSKASTSLCLISSYFTLFSGSCRALSTAKMPTLPRRIQKTLDPCVVLMKDLVGQHADEWKDKGGIFSLAQGVVYWKPPPSTITAVSQELQNSNNTLHMYGPDEGIPSLIEMLQTKIQQENNLRNHALMVTQGANQAYMNAVLTLLQPNDKAVVFKPYYFNHVMALQMTLYHEDDLLQGPCNDQGVPDMDWLARTLQQHEGQVKMVTIVNPGNPTGTLLSRHTLQQAVDICRQHECWLVLDNTYEYFCPNSDFDGCFEDPHVLHIFSLSKAYALAGYRCGYIVMDPSLYEDMLKVQDTIPIAPSRISQYAAIGALEAGKDWVREKFQSLDTGRSAIMDALSGLDKVMGGSGAMYVMGKLPDGTDDQEFARRLVQEHGVAVIPGSFCGFPGWIRVCYANLPPKQCLAAATRLRDGLDTLTTKD